MVFEAHYKPTKLVGLIILGLLFAALGWWMVQRPDGAFTDSAKIEGLAAILGVSDNAVGHGIGWVCALMGVAVLPVAAKRMSFAGPAIRIDQNGIYWHSWSDKPIPWSNIAGYRAYSIHRQKMIGLTLRDPNRDRSTSLLGGLARFNAMTGFGHVSLSAQSTDKGFDEMLQAVEYHSARHEQPMRETARQPVAASPVNPNPPPRTFGRRKP
jgi:type II secretory pathway pseudopilin PulG